MALNINNFSIEDAKRIAQSAAGQQLFSLLHAQNPQQLNSLMEQASSGNIEQLKKSLGSFLSSQEAQKLLKQLESESHE